MLDTWIVTIPPILVLIVAIATHNVLYSLLSGIIFACLLVSNFSPWGTLSLIFQSILKETQILNLFQGGDRFDHLYTFGFLIVLGIIIQLMAHTGGIRAYTETISRFLKNKRSAETTSLLLSLSFFLDDYLNNLTTGSIMRPIADKFAIPRAKLAYLLDSMSGPLCLLIPASSWVAFILMQLQVSGMSLDPQDNPLILADPLMTYVHTIPYLLYPILITISAWFVVRKKISFGTMYEYERIAETTGNLFGGKAPLATSTKDTESFTSVTGKLSYFIIPIGTFLISIPLTALYDAGWSPCGTLTWYKALQDADVILKALFLSSVISFFVSALYLLWQKSITLRSLAKVSYTGYDLMKGSLLVLLFAWTLSALLKDDLQTGAYLANLVMSSVPFYILPLAFFATSTMVTASTGSSWGTLTIMLPIGIPMLAALAGQGVPLSPAAIPLLFPILGAIFSGSASGSHISPITDTTVMSSSSAGSYHLDHVQTQIAYSMPAIISASIGFILFAVFPATTLSLIAILAITITLTLGMLLFRNYQRQIKNS